MLLLAAILTVRLSYAEGGEPRYFAITNARIVPVSGPVIEKGTVVIANGLIQAVGTSATIPPEAWVMDGSGLTVYPGLIDAATDIGLPKPEQPAGAPGMGGRRRGGAPTGEQTFSAGPEDRPGTTPWRVAADEIKTDDKRIETWRNAGFTSSLTVPAGGIFPGQASLIDLGGDRASEMVVKPYAALPLSFTPTGGFFNFPGSLMGVIGYMRQVFDDTAWYEEAEPVYAANVKASERIPYDRTEQTLARAAARKEIYLVQVNNSVEILRGLRLITEWKIPAVLEGAQQGYETAAAIAAQGVAVIVNLNWPEPPRDANPEGEQDLRDLRFRDRAPGTPAALSKAGVKFAFSSGGLDGPKEIQKRLKRAFDAGLSPDTALRAFTIDAASILGVDDRMGTVEAGKIANLVVTDGDIFNEKTKVKVVFVDGRRYEVHEKAPPGKPGEKKPMVTEGTDAAGVAQ